MLHLGVLPVFCKCMHLTIQRLVRTGLSFPVSSVGSEPMTLGSPTSPKPAPGAQFLPGFLMGDLPAPATPQPRPFSLASPLADSTGMLRNKSMVWLRQLVIVLVNCGSSLVCEVSLEMDQAPPHSR